MGRKHNPRPALLVEVNISITIGQIGLHVIRTARNQQSLALIWLILDLMCVSSYNPCRCCFIQVPALLCSVEPLCWWASHASHISLVPLCYQWWLGGQAQERREKSRVHGDILWRDVDMFCMRSSRWFDLWQWHAKVYLSHSPSGLPHGRWYRQVLSPARHQHALTFRFFNPRTSSSGGAVGRSGKSSRELIIIISSRSIWLILPHHWPKSLNHHWLQKLKTKILLFSFIFEYHFYHPPTWEFLKVKKDNKTGFGRPHFLQ